MPGINSSGRTLRPRKGLGALNLLSDKIGAFSDRGEQILKQFGVHIGSARECTNVERSAISGDAQHSPRSRVKSRRFHIDEMLSRIAILAKRVIEYARSVFDRQTKRRAVEPKVAHAYARRRKCQHSDWRGRRLFGQNKVTLWSKRPERSR